MNFFTSLKNRLQGRANLNALASVILIDGDVDAGCIIDRERAMEIAAYCACFQTLVRDVASIPLSMYQRTASGPQPAPWTQEGQRLLYGPNAYQTTQDWIEQVMTHLLGYGDYYAFRAQVGGLWDTLDSIVDPDTVTTSIVNGRQRHEVLFKDGGGKLLSKNTFGDKEIFHIHGPSADGYSGRVNVEIHRQTLSLARAVFRYGAKWFSNGGQPRGFLILPAGTPQDKIETAKALFKATYGGDNIHEVAAFTQGFDYKTLAVDPEKSQALGSRQQVTKEICALMDIPLWRFYNETPPNLDARTSYYMLSIRPHVMRIVDNINKQLIAPDSPNFYAAANLDAVLQADILTRFQAFGVAIQNRWMNPNQVAQRENLPTYPAGEEYINPHTLSSGTQEAIRNKANLSPG